MAGSLASTIYPWLTWTAGTAVDGTVAVMEGANAAGSAASDLAGAVDEVIVTPDEVIEDATDDLADAAEQIANAAEAGMKTVAYIVGGVLVFTALVVVGGAVLKSQQS